MVPGARNRIQIQRWVERELTRGGTFVYPFEVLLLNYLVYENSLDEIIIVTCPPGNDYYLGERPLIAENIENNNASLNSPIVPIGEVTQLTSYADSAPALVDKAAIPGPDITSIANPYERQDMDKVLKRSYKVAEFDWLTTLDFAQNIGAVEFPDALLEIENILDKLAQFKYLRSDVEVEIKINATQFHMGAVNVSYVSHGNGNLTPVNTPSKRLSLGTSMVMSISSVNSIKFVIPRTGPLFWDEVHLQDTGNLCHGSIGTIFLDCLTPVRLVGGDTSTNLTITVFASFVNPEVAGYGVSDVSAELVKKKTRRLLAQKEKSIDRKSVV